MLAQASLKPPSKPERKRFDLKGALLRRRKAAVTLLLALSLTTAALTLLAFAKLMPMRSDAAHSVETLERVRELDTALAKAREAVHNKDRTPREAQVLWETVEKPAAALAETIPQDDAERDALYKYRELQTSGSDELKQAVEHIRRGDAVTAVTARQYAHNGLQRLTDGADIVSRAAAAQLDGQMKSAVVWLAVCVALMLLSGLLMAFTVLTWAYANHLDRKAALRHAALDPQGEEALQAAQRLSQAIDNGPLAVVEWDADFVCTRWSGKAESIFGRTASQIIGTAWDKMEGHVHPDDRSRVQNELNPLLEGRADCVVIRHRNIRADGKVIHCVWYNSVLRDRDGKARTYLSLANDVTPLVEAENAYHAEADTVRRIAAAAPVGIAVHRSDGTLSFVNDYMLNLFGATRQDVLSGRGHLGEIQLEELDGTPIPEHERPSRIALAQGRTVTAREVRIRASGLANPVEVSVTAVPLRDKSGAVDGVLIIHDDISHRIKAETEREALATELSQSRRLEAVGNLAGGIAHDFGNALLAINYAADGLTAAAAAGEPTADHAARVRQAVGFARELTASLVNYAAGRDATRKPMDLAAFVSQSGKFLSRLLPSSFKVVAPPPGGQPVMVNASSTQLMQVLLNLVVNARDAMPDGGTITFNVSTRSGHAVLEATDTGAGISLDTARRIADKPYSTKDSGRGLGLTIVRQIAAEHGGTLEVHPGLGHGARLSVILPQITAFSPPHTPAPASPNHTTTTYTNTTVRRALVVEADDRIRPLIIQTLRNSDYQVESFTQTEAGLTAFGDSPAYWSVAILELDADGLDGATCLRRMRVKNPDLRAILLASDPADADGTLVDERTRVLLKPFTVAALRIALSDLHKHPVSQ